MSDFVSMRVIAEAAGVSKAAVSRVINGRPAGIRISAATRDRILAAVRQFGYQPTRFAQDQAPRRQATIALVLASGGLDASSSHLPAIDAVVTSNGYRLLLAILPADSGAARDRVAALLKDGVSGFLCAPAVMPVVIERVAGTCPVVVVGAVAGETILRSLGVDVPLPVIPPPVIQPIPVVSPPVIQPVPVAPPPVSQPVPEISPPVTQPTPSVVAAACPPEPERRQVPGGTVPEPILPVIPDTPAPSPVAQPEPVISQPIMPVVEPTPEPVVIEPPFIAPVTELDVADQAPDPAPYPQPLPDLVVSEPAPVPEPNPGPAPEPAVIETPPVPVPEPVEPAPPEPEPIPLEPTPEPEPALPPVEPVSAPVSVPEPESPQAEPVQPPAPTPDPESAPVPQSEPEPLPPPTEPAPTPTPIPTPEPAPIEIPLPVAPPAAIPDPVVEMQVDKPEGAESKGEDTVPEEDGTAQEGTTTGDGKQAEIGL
jgi:transcriptional regulator with XRE-family HTH domain